MYDFDLRKEQYQKLREAVIKFLDKFDEDRYFYQPTNKSNSTAWIVPHISAFEKIMVTDQIKGYTFDQYISAEEVEKYKPGVDGFSFKKSEMMRKEEAIKLLRKTQVVSVQFIDNLIIQDPSIKDVNQEIAFNRYLINFSHETEHFGQLKYLIGTWERTH